MYHSIADKGPAELAPYRVSSAAFRQQLQFLRGRGYHTIALDDWASCILSKRPIPGRPVIITFDDGYRDFFANAWPVLAAENMRATIFVVTRCVGSVVDWDSTSGPPMPLMGWDQLRALQAEGNAIASHCAAHRNLTESSDAEISADCAEVHDVLRRELGRDTSAIAFPWGLTNLRVRHLLAQNGYRVGVGVIGRLSTFADDMMDLPRIEIFGDDDLDAFALKIDAGGHEIEAAVDLRTVAEPVLASEAAPAPRSSPTALGSPPHARASQSPAAAKDGSPSLSAVAGDAPSSPRVAVVLTSCGRQDLLERTLDSFFAFNTYPLSQIIVVEDGPSSANAGLAAKYAERGITWLATESRVGQIAAIDYAYSYVDCPYIFHLEDDWQFFAGGFIEKSLTVLQSLPSCIQVWIRALDDTMGHPLRSAAMRVENIDVRRAEFGYLEKWHGFTFNPGLRRTQDYHRLGKYGFHVTFDPTEPYQSEGRLSEVYRDLGFYAVILADNEGKGYIWHIGDGRRIGPASAIAFDRQPRRAPDAGRHVATPSRLRIIVLGWLIRGPTGGMAWHYLNYLLGLAALGHDVYYMEDSDDYPCCYDLTVNPAVATVDPSRGLRFAAQIFDRLGFGNRWAYFDAHTGEWKGARASDARQLCKSADLLLNVSAINPVRPWTQRIPVRVLIDTDPGFTQIRNLTDDDFRRRSDAHTAFFTFGENIGKPCSRVPSDGLPWQPTRQPISLEAWPRVAPTRDGRYTTVMIWDSYATREYRGFRLGMKSESFRRFIALPRQLGAVFEIAVRCSEETAWTLRNSGWALADVSAINRDPWTYQRFIQASKGEFGIAKQGYVSTYGGWFSERSAAYMASGRPVLAQDTGFSEWLPTGRGVLPFRSIDDVIHAISEIDADYEGHCRAARELADEYFGAQRVLPHLIERAMAGRPASSDTDIRHAAPPETAADRSAIAHLGPPVSVKPTRGIAVQRT
jgi:peptidoglycan/xylan/chitin deacetylase (PgdA/CDA1 family)